LIRQASAWLPGRPPEPLPLQDLEESDAIRWVDIYAGDLDGAGLLALLAPICRNKLKHKMVRDLITPKRFSHGGHYRDSPVAMSFPSCDTVNPSPTKGGSGRRQGHLGVRAGAAPVGTTGCSAAGIRRGYSRLGIRWTHRRFFERSVPGCAERWTTSNVDSAEDLAGLVRSAASGRLQPPDHLTPKRATRAVRRGRTGRHALTTGSSPVRVLFIGDIVGRPGRAGLAAMPSFASVTRPTS
jgi:hypothetical protein